MRALDTSDGRGKATSKGPRAVTGTTVAKAKVSQKMIDKIKTDGMKTTLANISSGKVTANYLEGATRLYGATRVKDAKSSGAAKASNKAKSGNSNSPYGTSGAQKKRAGGGNSGMSSY